MITVEIPKTDKVRFLDQASEDTAITAVEFSDSRSKENFITLWTRPGQENTLLAALADKFWSNPQDRNRHEPPIFHRDDHDSEWSVTRHHYHIPCSQTPTKESAEHLIELVTSVTDRPYMSKALIESIKNYYKDGA
jgi:hypothetical protein